MTTQRVTLTHPVLGTVVEVSADMAERWKKQGWEVDIHAAGTSTEIPEAPKSSETPETPEVRKPDKKRAE